jgi:hypothetical protein
MILLLNNTKEWKVVCKCVVVCRKIIRVQTTFHSFVVVSRKIIRIQKTSHFFVVVSSKIIRVQMVSRSLALVSRNIIREQTPYDTPLQRNGRSSVHE